MNCRFWAKTVTDPNGNQMPGVSVQAHCQNVGAVAEQLLRMLSPGVASLFPEGTATLAALHDIGKITLGFQAKCPTWLDAQLFDELTRRQIPLSVSDHARVSQFFIQECLRPQKAHLWAVAVGAHHGRPKGALIGSDKVLEPLPQKLQAVRSSVAAQLIAQFGPLPTKGPRIDLKRDDPSLWLLAGLITVADWIGSNEAFFPADIDLPYELSAKSAESALKQIGWPGARLVKGEFRSAFGCDPYPMQSALLDAADAPGLFIVEAPMGCGKTEAALAAARRLIAAGQHHGFYFALPTQVTSNRIHLRVVDFLKTTLGDTASLRLAHGTSWLEDGHDLRLKPAFSAEFSGAGKEGDPSFSDIEEARSWFASAKHALLAPYGVGTIDQALQGMVTIKHFFVRRFALAGKVVILDEVHSYDVYTGSLVTALVRELLSLGCSVIVLSATLTAARRRELLATAGGDAELLPEPSAYPLISVARPSSPLLHIAPEPPPSKRVRLRAATISEEETISELITRAEGGQHVLWIRNTVTEAQAAFRLLRGDLAVASNPEECVPLGLLHSRFPYHRRKELEEEWLGRLGKHRKDSGPGSILVATQIVEQSVDIDLDFIVSDLAPTDMLLQRMGRLWRHPRAVRAAAFPEFWVRCPQLPAGADFRSIKKNLGRSARVYAPWVLLRTAGVFSGREWLTLPDDIRPLLEDTYASPREEEPASWGDAFAQLSKERETLSRNAAAAMLVSGRPVIEDDAPEALTRRAGQPTTTVLILSSVEPISEHLCRITTLDGSSLRLSAFEWTLAAAKFVHPWLVRVPRFFVPATASSPRWLNLHVPGGAVLAVIGEQGRLMWDGEPGTSTYHPDFGVQTESPNFSNQRPSFEPDNDDEFDY